MTKQAYDINVEQGQKITKGAIVLISVDLFEVNQQAFTVSSGTVSMYDGDDIIDLNVAAISVAVGVGLRSSVRVEFTMQDTWSSGLTASDDYYLIWSLILGDGQTRIVRQSLELRDA